MGRSRQPRLPLPDDGALITRTLWSDSEALRIAESWVRRRIYGLEKGQARALYDLYLQSYRELAGALTMAYDSDGKPIFARRAVLLEQMEREINALAAMAEIRIDTALIDAYQQGYAGRAWVLDQATNPDIPVRLRPVLPTQAIRSLLLQPLMGRDKRYLGQDWHTELGFAREEFILRTKRSLTASMAQGEGMAAAMRRLRDEYGIQTDRRKGFKRNFYQTTMIARTEIMRASNLGALAVYEENQDILNGWEWVATKDERTCFICGGMDGKRFKFSDAQMQPPSGSHPGCRCTIVPVLKDERLMNEVAGIRETYSEWAARRGMVTDGGLGGQRGAAPPRAKGKIPTQTTTVGKPWTGGDIREMQPIPGPLQAAGEQWSRELDADMRAAVDAWTGSGYSAINRVVTGEYDPTWDRETREFWQKVTDDLGRAIMRAPTTDEITWRGIDLGRVLRVGETAADYFERQVGTTLEWNQYASASLNPFEAARFSPGEQGAIFEIRSAKGRYIDPASRYGQAGAGAGAFEEPEFEVLFEPGQRFRVIEVLRDIPIYDLLEDITRRRTVVRLEDISNE